MSTHSTKRKTWQIRTSVDPRRSFDSNLLDALEAIQSEHGISESKAVMHLLWLGWNAYQHRDPPAVPAGALKSPGTALRSRPAPRMSRANLDREPPLAEAIAGAARGNPPPSPKRGPSLEAPIVDSVPLDRTPALVSTPDLSRPLPGGGGALMRLRTMAMSRSVVPHEDARSGNGESPAPQALAPALLASTLAKLKSEGRQF